MQSHTNKGTEEKETGFPLTTGGKDRGARVGMTEGPERVQEDRWEGQGARADMTGGTGGHDGTDSRFFEVVGIGSHLTRVTADVSS